jgi:hypothetical protein
MVFSFSLSEWKLHFNHKLQQWSMGKYGAMVMHVGFRRVEIVHASQSHKEIRCNSSINFGTSRKFERFRFE